MQPLIIKKIAFIPSESVTVRAMELPVKALAQAIKVMPFALEEQLSQDVETLHFAVSRYDKQWLAWTCTASLVTEWLTQIEEQGESVNTILPDYFILPYDDGPSIHIENGRALVRLDKQIGFAVNEALLDTALQFAEVDRKDCTVIDEPMRALAEQVSVKGIGCNLLRGKFGKTISFAQWTKPWGLSVAASILGLAVYIGQLKVENEAIAKSVVSQSQVNLARFKELFPDIRRIVNMRTQAKQQFERLERVKKLRQTSLSALLQAGVPVLKDNPEIKVESIKYANYAMLLEISAPTVSAVETFNGAIQKTQGLVVQVEGLSQDGERVSSSLNIRKDIE